MSSENVWQNDDGLEVRFGTRSVELERAGVTRISGNEGEYVLRWQYDDLPAGASITANTSYGVIPAGAIVTDAYVTAVDAFAGGTSYDIGLNTSAGVAIDADGLFDAITLAEINAGDSSRGHAGTNSGVLLDQPLASDAQVVATATGAFTAGRAKLVIRYVLPVA